MVVLLSLNDLQLQHFCGLLPSLSFYVRGHISTFPHCFGKVGDISGKNRTNSNSKAKNGEEELLHYHALTKNLGQKENRSDVCS